MSSFFLLFLCSVLIHTLLAFRQPSFGMSSSLNRLKRTNAVAKVGDAPASGAFDDGIPEQLRNHKCLYDMILVERLKLPETTKSGLYVPKVDKDEKRVGRVVAMPRGYGVESARGNVVPIEVLAPFKVGDMVYVKERWGNGPLDIEIEKRLFSFMRSVNVIGLVGDSENSP